MNIREALAAEHSKRKTTAIVDYVGDDPKRFKELMDVFLSDDYRPVQREPSLMNELRLLTEKHIPHATVALRVRSKSVLA